MIFFMNQLIFPIDIMSHQTKTNILLFLSILRHQAGYEVRNTRKLILFIHLYQKFKLSLLPYRIRDLPQREFFHLFY